MSHKEEPSANMWQCVDKPENHHAGNESSKRNQSQKSPIVYYLYEMTRIGKSIETEIKLLLACDCELRKQRKRWVIIIKTYKVSFLHSVKCSKIRI